MRETTVILNYFSFNMITFLNYLNEQLVTLRVYQYKGHSLNIKVSADIKAFWQLLGMCVSSGTFPCPLCLIRYTDMHVPLENRGSRPARSLGHCHFQYGRYAADDKAKMADYDNVVRQPLLQHAPNGEEFDEEEIVDWAVISLVHINMRVGEDLQGFGCDLCKEIDRELVYAMAEDGRLMKTWKIVEGSDFHTAVCDVLKGCLPKVPTSGPAQEAYTRACSSKGCKLQHHFGGVMNGNDAIAFAKADLQPFWQEVLAGPYLTAEKREELLTKVESLNRIRKVYRDLFTKIGGTDHVTEEEINDIELQVKAFLSLYRKILPCFPVKIHILEDHLVGQIRKFGVCLGLLNEQGGEGSHHFLNKKAKFYANVKDPSVREKAMVEQATISSILELRKT